MKLTINNTSYLSDIQKEFNRLFPSWKLEFAFKGNEQLNLSANHKGSFPYVRINELCKECNTSADINIEDSMTAEEVEHLFLNKFKLPVSLFIKKGAYWMKSSIRNKKPLNATFD